MGKYSIGCIETVNMEINYEIPLAGELTILQVWLDLVEVCQHQAYLEVVVGVRFVLMIVC